MKISGLIRRLLSFWWKYGNWDIDLLTEDETCQTECELGDLAVSISEGRIKLLPKGFT